ncbi:MAG: VanZ family protein [Ardenticatenaceae bacterium]|nr:VanZ family protein [Ardenticatenaceae bacterium]HBY92517.1 hypothetical protein [Chloroflexota bacterium]
MNRGSDGEGHKQPGGGVGQSARTPRLPPALDFLLASWGPAILWMAVIFWFSAQPDLPSAPNGLLDFGIKKGAHLTVYAILTVLYRRALHRTWRPAQDEDAPRSRAYSLATLALSLLYAISDEWHQAYTPGRHPRLLDLLIDLTGALIGLGLWQLAQHFHHRLDRNRREERRLVRTRATHLDEL